VNPAVLSVAQAACTTVPARRLCCARMAWRPWQANALNAPPA